MGFKSYVEEKYMEDEPIGGILLDAAYNEAIAEINDIDPSFAPSCFEDVLKQIGIREDDDIETIKTKLKFAIRAPDSAYIARHREEFRANSRVLVEELRSDGVIREPGDVVNIKAVRSKAEVAKIFGMKAQPTPSIAEFQDETFKEDAEGIRKAFRAVLQWLDN